jgi:hypothetical protein
MLNQENAGDNQQPMWQSQHDSLSTLRYLRENHWPLPESIGARLHPQSHSFKCAGRGRGVWWGTGLVSHCPGGHRGGQDALWAQQDSKVRGRVPWWFFWTQKSQAPKLSYILTWSRITSVTKAYHWVSTKLFAQNPVSFIDIQLKELSPYWDSGEKDFHSQITSPLTSIDSY